MGKLTIEGDSKVLESIAKRSRLLVQRNGLKLNLEGDAKKAAPKKETAKKAAPKKEK